MASKYNIEVFAEVYDGAPVSTYHVFRTGEFVKGIYTGSAINDRNLDEVLHLYLLDENYVHDSDFVEAMQAQEEQEDA